MSQSRDLFKFEMNFFKILQEISKRTTIYLQIPETLISGFGFSSPTLFCTDQITGELIIKKDISPEAISECFNYLQECESDPVFPIAAFKIGINGDQAHAKVLFSAQECQQRWDERQNSNRAIQRYIRNNNAIALVQTFWEGINSKFSAKEIVKHKNIKNIHEEYKKTVSNVKRKSVAREIKSKANRDMFQILQGDKDCYENQFSFMALERKAMYLVNLIEKYFLIDSNLKISNIEADWIQDNSGLFYLIHVKKYRIVEIEAFKTCISLFHIPKVEISKFIIDKPRPPINIKKKLSIGTSGGLSKSFNPLPKLFDS